MRVHLADWAAAQPRVMPLRIAVFVDEQGVPADMERDADDPLSRHAWIDAADGTVVATGRLLPDGHIGRLAVRADQRGHGLGSRVLRALMDTARDRGQGEVVLHAQLQALPFYTRHGFVPVGEPFMEAGIAHLCMRCPLASTGS
ncbi:GNAT family N-acetyltransferase [Nitrogeniibacter mangrovi]|uniref:GNAT family N-acetyltransferase n=1 Tax=Nitrogeniibacter mangrovi TaxID=2016596 RepID=A0A6C1B512_9RHOO|nr:GNAT family N-acetyltransferase [Nitrogeniibacter mangrovi]QID17955.1 GNAT family N-acetyltransferase [Nitrogeniibacter mangrovi]